MSNYEQLSRGLQEIGLLIDAMVSQRDSLREQRDALLDAVKAFVVGWDAAEDNPANFCDELVMAALPSIEPLRAAIAACERNENA